MGMCDSGKISLEDNVGLPRAPQFSSAIRSSFYAAPFEINRAQTKGPLRFELA